MNRIALLAPLVVDQIAAGEVVERPASVVRELLDNAKDAGARSIVVHVDSGGLGRIEVIDDGHGMTSDDATLAVERHATSKIRAVEDLQSLSTYGFRGEALPSIASVARLCIRTRTEGAQGGVEVVVAHGQKSTRAIACEVGTSVAVEELFQTVPVRKKFLKAAATENAWVTEAVTEAALSDPSLRVVLFRDGKRVLEFLPSKTQYERVAQVYAGEKLIGIDAHRADIHVTAMLSAPERARNAPTALYLYVNGRRVKDRAFSRAVQFAYGSVLPAGKYPAGAVFVEIEPSRVDVNVHPQKTEVRFQDARSVYDAISRALADGLGTQPFARISNPMFAHPMGLPASSWAPTSGSANETNALPLREADPWGLVQMPEMPPSQTFANEVDRASWTPTQGFASLRALTQAYKTFVVCESDAGLVFLDQHAADERVRFDGLKRGFRERAVAKQRLLFPERVVVAEADVAFAIEHSETISGMGLEIAKHDAVTLMVHTVPALVRKTEPEKLLREVLAELSFAGTRAFGDRIDMALATIACHAAIRAGDDLTQGECQALLASLDRVQSFEGYCPHGRPVAFFVSRAELARGVGRTSADF